MVIPIMLGADERRTSSHTTILGDGDSTTKPQPRIGPPSGVNTASSSMRLRQKVEIEHDTRTGAELSREVKENKPKEDD